MYLTLVQWSLLKGESGSEVIDDLFQQAMRGKIALYMSIVNLLEVYYGFISDIGLKETMDIKIKLMILHLL